MVEETIVKEGYTYEQVLTSSLSYFKGDELAATTWINKYALKNYQGMFLEKNPDDMHKRMAREFAKIEDLVLDDTADGDLFRAHWKTPEERKTFSQAYSKYWSGKHSDEIYQEFKGGRK